MVWQTLTGEFWASAIFYAADISNFQYRTDLEMFPHESPSTEPSLTWGNSSPSVLNAGSTKTIYEQINVRTERLMIAENQQFTVVDLLWTICPVMFGMFLVTGHPRPTFVSTNNLLFWHRCPIAKDSPSDFRLSACLASKQMQSGLQRVLNELDHLPSGSPCIWIRLLRCYNCEFYGNSKMLILPLASYAVTKSWSDARLWQE